MGRNKSGARPGGESEWTPEPGTNPWERQPCDTEKSFAGFVAYRDLGPDRSITKAVAAMGKKPNYKAPLEAWCAKHFWRKRCSAWDTYNDTVNLEAQIEARRAASRDMVERHLKLSTHLQRLASIELMRWIHKIGGDRDNPDLQAEPVLIPQHIQSLLDYAIKLERLNRNEPESITESRDKALSQEELETRIRHLLKTRVDE